MGFPDPFGIQLFGAGATKKEAPLGTAGGLITFGGTFSSSPQQYNTNTSTYAPTTTNTSTVTDTRSSNYAPVYAPTYTIVEGSPNASVTKKDQLSGSSPTTAPSVSVPTSAGGVGIAQPIGGGSSGPSMGAFSQLVNNLPGLAAIGVGGLILYGVLKK